MKIISYVEERAKANERAKHIIKSDGPCNSDRFYFAGVKLSGDLLAVYPKSSYFVSSGFGAGGIERGEIKSLSQSSAARMGRYLRECVAEYRVFITLTYPPGFGRDGKTAKRDLHVFFKRCARYVRIKQDQFSMFWFMEFQKTGTIHYHIFTTHRFDIKWLSNAWYEIVGSKNPHHLKAGTNIQKLKAGKAGTCSYARKYAAKSIQKVVPAEFGWSGRFWGVHGLKTQVSAGCNLTAKSMKSDNVVRLLTKLSDLVEKEISKGKIRVIKTENHPAKLFSVKDKYVLYEVRSYIERISIVNFFDAGISNWDANLDLEEYNSDAEKEWVKYVGDSGKRWREKMLLQASQEQGENV